MASLSHHSHRKDAHVAWAVDYRPATLTWQISLQLGSESLYLGDLEREDVANLHAALEYALHEAEGDTLV